METYENSRLPDWGLAIANGDETEWANFDWKEQRTFMFGVGTLVEYLSPLGLALRLEKYDCLVFMLHHGLNPNADSYRNNKGRAAHPLIEIVSKGNHRVEELVLELLAAGSNKQITYYSQVGANGVDFITELASHPSERHQALAVLIRDFDINEYRRAQAHSSRRRGCTLQ